MSENGRYPIELARVGSSEKVGHLNFPRYRPLAEEAWLVACFPHMKMYIWHSLPTQGVS